MNRYEFVAVIRVKIKAQGISPYRKWEVLNDVRNEVSKLDGEFLRKSDRDVTGKVLSVATVS